MFLNGSYRILDIKKEKYYFQPIIENYSITPLDMNYVQTKAEIEHAIKKNNN